MPDEVLAETRTSARQMINSPTTPYEFMGSELSKPHEFTESRPSIILAVLKMIFNFILGPGGPGGGSGLSFS